MKVKHPDSFLATAMEEAGVEPALREADTGIIP
jgi:hypothetical protein